MKKLLMSVGAAGLALGAVADLGNIREDCDISTYAYSSDYDHWRVLMEGATPHKFWLSRDMSSPSYESFEVATYSPSVVASGTIDFQNHKMQPNWSLFYIRAWASGETPELAPVSTLTVKNGTIEGRRTSDTSGDTLYVGNFGNATGWKGNVVLDNMTITNYDAIALGLEMQDSTVLIKDSHLQARWVAPFLRDHNGESDCTITFQNTTVDTTDNYYTDFTSVPDTTANLLHKLVYTGSKTRVWTGDNFLFGYGLPYFEAEILDGAQFVTSGSFYIGFNATANYCKLRVDNATLDGGWAMLVGHRAHHQMVSCNESKLDVDEVYVGYHSDNNTMVATNCDFSSVVFMRVGGTSVNTDAPNNNKLYICGQNTKFHATRLPFEFYGANGLISVDDVTINLPNWEICYCPVNTKGDESTAWENNEISFNNGSTVTIGDCFMGKPFEANKLCNYERMSVTGDSTLSVNAMIVGGCYNTLTIDNSTIEARSSNQLLLGKTESATKDQPQTGNKLVLKGDHPKFRNTTGTGEMYVYNQSTIEFNLPEAATYQEVPIITHIFKGPPSYVEGESYITFSFPNLETIRDSLVGEKEVELIRCTGAIAMTQDSYATESALLEYINSTLPSGCYVHRDGEGWSSGSIWLHIKGGAVAKPGAVLIVK